MNNEKNVAKIGHIAQMLDAEYTTLERMKIKKESILRLCYAFIIYLVVMYLFTLIL